MRIKRPPGIRLGGTIGLCVALAAFGACTAPDADSPVAGSAAPVPTIGRDADRAAAEPVASPPAGAGDTSSGGTAGRRAPGGATTADGTRPTVEQPTPNEGTTAAPAALGGGAGEESTVITATTGTPRITATAPLTPTVPTAPTTSTVPPRTDRHPRTGAPGTAPTTNPARRSAATTTATTTTTPAAAGPAAPPVTEPPPGAASPPTAPPSGTSSASMAEAISLVNAARVEAGLAPLVDIASLHAAAEAHALDQASMQAMTHIGTDGSDPGDRIARSGFPATAWGENLAAGYGSADALIADWLAADGDHRSNLLDPTFTAVGVASAEASDGTIYWTMVMAG
jgi:uncharacterized protein YkwD